MALIKCPECGQDVSDKADKCPHCGVGIAEMFDIVLCCPYCMSSRIDPVNKKFSAAKAALGYICIGNIGVLAGAAGINKEEFTCRTCGNRFKGYISPRVKEMEREEIKKELIYSATSIGEEKTDYVITKKLGIKNGYESVLFKDAFFKHNHLCQYKTEQEKESENSVIMVIFSLIVALIAAGGALKNSELLWEKILFPILAFAVAFIGTLALFEFLNKTDPNKKKK